MNLRSVLIAFVAVAVVACEASSTPAEGDAPVTPSIPISIPSSSGDARPGTTTTPPPSAPAEAPPVSSAKTWGPAHCPAAGKVGFAVGDTLGDLGLKDCDTGANASLDELCGASATWLFAAHTHCPTCQATSGFLDEVASAVADKNVAIVLSVHDDNGTSCAKWREVYKLAGLPNVRVYADPEKAVWNRLQTKGYTAPSAFLDGKRVVTFKEHSLVKADVLAQIDAALARP